MLSARVEFDVYFVCCSGCDFFPDPQALTLTRGSHLFMNGRKPTSKERKWLTTAAQVPCLICDLYHDHAQTPAELHHLNGQRSPGAHFRTISLCSRHHRIKDNKDPQRWISRHGDGRKAFEDRYQPEEVLLTIQVFEVDKIRENTV